MDVAILLMIASLEVVSRMILGWQVSFSVMSLHFTLPIGIFVAFWPLDVVWAQWIDFAGQDANFMTIAVLTPALVIVAYWVHGLMFLVLDLMEFPALFRFKIQKTKHFDRSRLPAIVLNILFGQFFIMWPLCILIWRTGRVKVTREVPPGFQILLDLLAFVVVDEIGFYYMHRLFHESKLLYGSIHKIHHSFTAPIALAADFCHPVEHLFVNLIPNVAAGPIFGTNAISLLIWWTIGTFGTQGNHSGFHFPFFLDPEEDGPSMHDLHHEKFNCNFGTNGWMDRIHGTYKNFRGKK